MRVAVVTPTIGSEHLAKCVASVDSQTYPNLVHYVFADGQEHFDKIQDVLEGAPKVKKIALEENVGKGWYGHRVYAACSFLVNADVIIYLDEDNWLEPDHVKNAVETLQKGNDWVYSLRKIYDKDGNYLCEDDCESLGKWPVYFNDQVFHIDTSCFAVRRDVAVRIGHAWYGQWGADRQFFNNLKQHFQVYECTSESTLCYRLDGNPNSVTKEFFDKGNAITNERYGAELPWRKKNTYKKTEIAPGLVFLE